MKAKKHLVQIAAILESFLKCTLSILALVIMILACAVKEVPLFTAFLIVLAWVCWFGLFGFYLVLQFELLYCKCNFPVRGYIILRVVRVVYYVLLALFIAVLSIFVVRASRAKVLSDVLSTLIGPLFKDALASTKIKRLFRLTEDNVINWMLLAFYYYAILLAVQLLLCAMANCPGKSTNRTSCSTTTKPEKKKVTAEKTGDGLLDA